MLRKGGTTFPCVIFGLCNRDSRSYQGVCDGCQVRNIFVELNKLERGKGIRAIRTKLDSFPCAIWRRSGCAKEPKEGHEHICERCKVRGVYLEYMESWAKEDTSWLHREDQ